jgi:lipopolysaccharide biosynthesis regulator YciM
MRMPTIPVLVKHLGPALLLLLALALPIPGGVGTAWGQAEDDLSEGDRYFEEGEWRKAAASYDAAIRKFPGQVSPEAYGKRAAIFIIVKDLKGGLTFIREIANKQHPGAPEIGEQEALILWELGEKPAAIDIAERVTKAKPSVWSNQRLIGEYYSTRDPAKTAGAYEAYLSNRPSEQERADVLPRIRLGFAYLALARTTRDPKAVTGFYDRAVTQFETVSRKHGKQPHAQVNADNGLCASYAGQKKFDRAITVCERIIQDPRRIDANGSVWFNLGVAYLAKKQPRRARTAANEYVRLRKNEARGYLLIGDSYFQDRDWNNALDYYLRAEKLLKPNQQREQVSLSVQLGKTYRRLPAPASGGANANLTLAIEKLEAGMQASPSSLELGVELGGAYLESKQDGKALGTADRLIASKEFAQNPDDLRTGVLLVAAKSLYNQGKLKESRGRFESAYALRPKDVQVRRGLVETINQQAWQSMSKNDAKGAEVYLAQALEVDARSPMTSLNLAVLAVDKNDCDGAQRHLEKIKGSKRGYTVTYERLMGRTYLCRAKPDRAKAAEHYANADREVKKVQANLLQAEIFTEWAPLTMESNIDDAVDKLQAAVQFSAQSPEVAPAAKRNLAIALFKRGWKLMKEGKAGEAASDFERANREPALLKGTEPLAFEFSAALASLEKGEYADAAKTFKQLSTRGNQSGYLRAPYNKVGSQFFSAYANYRSSNINLKQQAAGEFAQLQGGASGSFAAKIRDLLASSWEMVAYEQWRQGKNGPSAKSLTSAQKYAEGDLRRRVTHNRAVLDMGRDQIDTFESLGGVPAEALVNLGILYDQAGRARDAYEAWQRARAKGVGGRDLQKWIDAKKRIYGF